MNKAFHCSNSHPVNFKNLHSIAFNITVLCTFGSCLFPLIATKISLLCS